MSINGSLGGIDIVDTKQSSKDGEFIAVVGIGVSNVATYNFKLRAYYKESKTDEYSESGNLGNMEQVEIEVPMSIGGANKGDEIRLWLQGDINGNQKTDEEYYTVQQSNNGGGGGGGDGDGIFTRRNIAIAGLGIAALQFLRGE